MNTSGESMESSKSGKIMKSFLLFTILLIFLLPSIQNKFHLIKEAPLKGVYTLKKADSLTLKNWISCKYQQSLTTRFNGSSGFRPTFVRLIDQVNFSLFNQASNPDIILGKSGYLYEYPFIRSFLGRDKINYGGLRKKIHKLYQIQNFLENKGIHFILIFAPSKARVFPEYIPSRYLLKKKRASNYDEYVQIIGKECPDLHLIDVNAYFKKLKKTSGFPLYSKVGTHWTNYALYRYFLDTLVHYMGSFQKRRFPELKQQNLHWSNDLISPDDDLLQILNLFNPGKDVKLPYADFSFDIHSIKDKSVLLMISDSYNSMLYESSAFNSILSRNDFWYYNKIRYPEEFYKASNDPVFLRDDLLKHDFVILMATETNLPDLFLFPEITFSRLGLAEVNVKEIGAFRKERIEYYIRAIYNNPEWLDNIKKQVRRENKTLEALIEDNAEYMEWKEHSNNNTK